MSDERDKQLREMTSAIVERIESLADDMTLVYRDQKAFQDEVREKLDRILALWEESPAQTPKVQHVKRQ